MSDVIIIDITNDENLTQVHAIEAIPDELPLHQKNGGHERNEVDLAASKGDLTVAITETEVEAEAQVQSLVEDAVTLNIEDTVESTMISLIEAEAVSVALTIIQPEIGPINSHMWTKNDSFHHDLEGMTLS